MIFAKNKPKQSLSPITSPTHKNNNNNKTKLKLKGLKNWRNICYMNCAIQCLNNTEEF